MATAPDRTFADIGRGGWRAGGAPGVSAAPRPAREGEVGHGRPAADALIGPRFGVGWRGSTVAEAPATRQRGSAGQPDAEEPTR